MFNSYVSHYQRVTKKRDLSGLIASVYGIN
jgi:hypothetical protein